MTGLFHKEKKQVSFIERAIDKKVSVIGQCVYTIIPFFALFIHIWVFSRIEKLTKGLLYTIFCFIAIAGSYYLIKIFYTMNDDQFLWYVIAGLLSTQVVMLFFLVRWSREWNKKINENINKMIHEKHIGDCVECGQKLDKFYVNCPSCNKIFLKKGHEQEAELLNKSYRLN